MLSNTATPKYYGQFRERVLNGEIPICHEICLEMYRIDELIENPRYYYDDLAVEGYISFCENELTLTDGSDLVLLDSFKLWAEEVFGWYYFIERSVYVPNHNGYGGRYENRRIKRRLVNKQYLIVGRGASKSLYLSTIQAYYLTIDKRSTHQVATAPTMRQAEEVVSPIKTAIVRARGPYFQFLTEGSLQNTTGARWKRKKLAATKDGIRNFLTNSHLEVWPMTIDKLQGIRSICVTVDEWLSGDIREDPIGAIEQGTSKNDDYFIGCVSSEGTVRNGPGDSIKMELLSILNDDWYNPHVSIFWYKLDDVKEVAQQDLWLKANPNIGITVQPEVIQLDVEKAENNPSSRNDILAKRFGIPMEGYTYFFTYEETLPHRRKYFWNLPCSLGADLSLGDDFCAFSFLFPLRGGAFGINVRCYITEHTLVNLSYALREKYEDFITEGTLVVMEGTILDMDEVYEDLINFIEVNDADVRCFGYDVYNSREFLTRWIGEYGEYGVLKVPQGVRTESVPLGELKKLAEKRDLVFYEQLMVFCMGNCIAYEDSNGNRKLDKRRREEKIDAVAATMDAFIAWKAFKDEFE